MGHRSIRGGFSHEQRPAWPLGLGSPRETGWPRSCRGRFADELPDLKDLSLQQKTAEANVRSPLFGRPTELPSNGRLASIERASLIGVGGLQRGVAEEIARHADLSWPGNGDPGCSTVTEQMRVYHVPDVARGSPSACPSEFSATKNVAVDRWRIR